MEPWEKKVFLVGFLLIFLGANMLATQVLAYQLGYQEALPWALWQGDGYTIYLPCAWILWWQSFGTEENNWFWDKYGFTFFILPIIFSQLLFVLYRSLKIPKPTDSHGSAHFATMEDIQSLAGTDNELTSGKGAILGVMEDGTLLRDNSKTHILVCAPTRSGKGVGIIIPTLLTWNESVVVTDIKGENWELTSAWRKQHLHNKVLKFEPTSDFSSKYNPFDEIRIGTKFEIRDIQNIVKILVDPTGKGSEGSSAHWINNASALLTAVILHLKYLKQDANMYDILEFLYNGAEKPTLQDAEGENTDMPDESPESNATPKLESLQERMGEIVHGDEEFVHDPTGVLFGKIYGPTMAGKMHPIVRQYFQSMVEKPDKEFGSILSTLDTVLNTYRDPIIAHNMSRSDFRMSDLMNSKDPVSLYLVFPPSDLDRVKPVFRVIIELLYRKNTEPMKFVNGQQVQKNHRMLMLLDEFPALGKLETFEAAMAYIAGYGIKAMIITQDINQIEKLYTASNSIVSNCQVQVYHTPTDNKTPEFISKKMGNATIQVQNVSVKGSQFNLGDRTYSYNASARPLMTGDEVNTMDKNKELVFISGMVPILAQKIRYYEVPYFLRKTQLPPLEATDILIENLQEEGNKQDEQQGFIDTGPIDGGPEEASPTAGGEVQAGGAEDQGQG